jgi:hypothetical protein
MLKWMRGKAGSVRVPLPDLRERHTSPAFLPMARVCSRQRESCWTGNPSMEDRQMHSPPWNANPHGRKVTFRTGECAELYSQVTGKSEVMPKEQTG